MTQMTQKTSEQAFLHKELTYAVIGAAMEVHRVLGPGFPEQVYQEALECELTLRHIPFESQRLVRVVYKGRSVADYYLDLVVDGKVVVELKAVGELASVHQSQVISYLKASGLRVGLLLNFGEQRLRYKRVIL
ncbi:MAG TPA: GxxExxY protein [Aggregatilineales bacterium]|nr:GxxExxY protein [Aggregatilineales bacterium]